MHLMRMAASRTFCTAGRSRPISTAMMAITTSSSIKVKPRPRCKPRTLVIGDYPLGPFVRSRSDSLSASTGTAVSLLRGGLRTQRVVVPGGVIKGLADTFLPQAELKFNPVAAPLPLRPPEPEDVHHPRHRLAGLQHGRPRGLRDPLGPRSRVDLPLAQDDQTFVPQRCLAVGEQGRDGHRLLGQVLDCDQILAVAVRV